MAQRAHVVRGARSVLQILSGSAIAMSAAIASAQPAPAPVPAPAPSPAPAPAAAAEEASPAALAFGKKCSGCHTIGDGDRTGPDLLGVTQRRDKAWIATFVKSPGAAIDAGDPVANELLPKFKGLRMPDQQFGSDQEIDDLIAYLADCTAKGGCKPVLGKVRKASDAKPEEIALGRSLFEGTTPLGNGGPPCISCHNVRGIGVVGGGTLAKDLTFVYARLGDDGLESALGTTPFPLMKDIYAGSKKPLRPSEAYAIKAFLYDVHRDGTPPSSDHDFVYLGVAGLAGSLGMVGLAWSGRMKGQVRKGIAKRARGVGRPHEGERR